MKDKNFEIKYTGQLRCGAVHLKSGAEIITDAPLDNKGKGQSFSPTDLVATGLTTCILTIAGLRFSEQGRELTDIYCDVKKVMASDPRRIVEIKIDFNFGENEFSMADLKVIEHLIHHCPVSESLNPEIQITSNIKSFF